jgi:hypothetical protein
MSRQAAIAIVLLALLVRGFVCFRDLEQYSADPDAYRVIAETLANTGVYGMTSASGKTRATAYRPPLYPFVLSRLVLDGKLSLHAIAALHTLLGCVTVLCTYRAGRRLLGEIHSTRASILAASWVIVDPVLLQQSTLVMTETMATAIASLVLWWWACHAEGVSAIGTAVALGALLAIAYLCRPTFLVWAVMLTVCVALANSHVSKNKSWRAGRAAIVGAIILLAVGFWTVRNVRRIGHPVWATTHGGYTLLLGNNPLFYDYLRTGGFGTTWNAEPFLVAYSHRYDADPRTEAFWKKRWDARGTITVNVSEYEDDRLAYDAAKATIMRQSSTFVWSCVVRVARLWSPLPHRTPERSSTIIFAIGIYYALFYLAVGIGLWRLGGEIKAAKWWPVWSLVLTLTLVHALYWSNIRMRAPVIPALAIIAAATIRRPEETDR